MIMKKQAFTLAEILITLGIIGMVAAMTIPSLMNRINNADLTSRFNKAISVFSSAVELLKAENGGSLTNVYSNQNIALDAFCTKLKCTMVCHSTDDVKQCYHSSNWYMLDGRNGWVDYSLYNVSAILSDGMIFSMGWAPTCNLSDGVSINICTVLSMDTNGLRGPNKMGRDIFEIYVTPDKLIPDGSAGTSFYYSSNPTYCDPTVKTAPYNGAACGGKIMAEGTMNY